MYRSLCQVFTRLGFFSLLRSLNRNSVAILMYHGVRDSNSHEDLTEHFHLNVCQDEFQRQMTFLRQHYEIVSLSGAMECLRARRPLKPYSIAITFDDGYLNNYTHALPICRDLETPFTLYVVTGFIEHGESLWTDRLGRALSMTYRPALDIEIEGTPYHLPLGTTGDRDLANQKLLGGFKSAPAARIAGYLQELETRLGIADLNCNVAPSKPCTWDMLREMARSGLVEIGAHTASHSILTRLSGDEATRELLGSKNLIENRIGVPCRHFAYPNGKPGDFSPDTERLVRQSGYHSAVTTVEGFNRIGDNPFTLRRLGVYGHYGVQEFQAMITGFHGSLARLLGRS